MTNEEKVHEAAVRGGEITKAKIGSDGYKAMGKAGGTTTAARHGPEYFSEIGKRGGGKVLERYGPEHFRAMAKKGAARIKELIARGRAVENDSVAHWVCLDCGSNLGILQDTRAALNVLRPLECPEHPENKRVALSIPTDTGKQKLVWREDWYKET